MQEDDAYIGDLVRARDQDRFWSALLVPEPQRSDLLALYALHVELVRIADQVSEPQLGEIRLQWWRDALDGVLRAGGSGDHPVLEPLARAVRRHELPSDTLQDMINAHQFDLYPELLPDHDALGRYMAETIGPLFRLGLTILGASDRDALCARATEAFGLTQLLRSLPVDASRGRVFLPQTLLAAHGVHPDVIRQGTDNEDVRAALRDMREKALEALNDFRQQAAGLPREVRPVFAPLALVKPYLDRLASPRHDPVRAIVQINPLRRYTLIWRAYLSGRF